MTGDAISHESAAIAGLATRSLGGAAPLGDPLDIEVRGCRFSLRRAEAEAIGVVTLSPAVEAVG